MGEIGKQTTTIGADNRQTTLTTPRTSIINNVLDTLIDQVKSGVISGDEAYSIAKINGITEDELNSYNLRASSKDFVE